MPPINLGPHIHPPFFLVYTNLNGECQSSTNLKDQTEWHFIDSFIVCSIIFLKNRISIREVKFWNGFYVALILCKHQGGCYLFKCLEMSIISWNLKRGCCNLQKNKEVYVGINFFVQFWAFIYNFLKLCLF